MIFGFIYGLIIGLFFGVVIGWLRATSYHLKIEEISNQRIAELTTAQQVDANTKGVE